MNADLAGCNIPIHADISQIDALLVEEDAPWVDRLGVKGVGGIGVTGTVGALNDVVERRS